MLLTPENVSGVAFFPLYGLFRKSGAVRFCLLTKQLWVIGYLLNNNEYIVGSSHFLQRQVQNLFCTGHKKCNADS